MSTFDGWETRLYGDAMALPAGQLSDNELMHFRTKGSKNGVRRFQQPDGTWTPLGLKERKEREGWGEEKAKKKAKKKAEKAEKKVQRANAKKEKRELRKEAKIIKKAKASENIKNLSDQELQNRIRRVKMELEYKELTKNPVIKTAENLVSSYMKNKEKKLEREAKKAELVVKQQEAKSKLIAAKAANTTAKNSILDNVLRGSKYKQAQAKLIETKGNYTVRGAVRKVFNGIIRKEGDRIVNEMGDKSLIMRGGRKAKAIVDKSRDWTVDRIKDAYLKDTNEHEKRMKEKEKKRNRNKGSDLRG